MLHTSQLELSYFSLQLFEYLIQNHPHRADDYDFIKYRGDKAAEAFEVALRNGALQEDAIQEANEELYKGLYFSLYALIKDVLWSDFLEVIPAHKVEYAAKKLYPHLFSLHPQFDPSYTAWGFYKEDEMGAVNEDELRKAIAEEVNKVIALGYGI